MWPIVQADEPLQCSWRINAAQRCHGGLRRCHDDATHVEHMHHWTTLSIIGFKLFTVYCKYCETQSQRTGVLLTKTASDNIPTSMSTPPPSDQMRASGSGRRKVALPPGRSQLDWMRNSRAIQRKRARPITIEEVAAHKSRSDAWMVVDNTVYDVTPYIEYHPGGIPMLMSGAGKVLSTDSSYQLH